MRWWGWFWGFQVQATGAAVVRIGQVPYSPEDGSTCCEGANRQRLHVSLPLLSTGAQLTRSRANGLSIATGSVRAGSGRSDGGEGSKDSRCRLKTKMGRRKGGEGRALEQPTSQTNTRGAVQAAQAGATD